MNELNEWKNFNLKELFKLKDQNFTLLKYIWMLNKYKYLNLVTVNVISLWKKLTSRIVALYPVAIKKIVLFTTCSIT